MRVYVHGKYTYDLIDKEGGVFPLKAICTIQDHHLSSSEPNINSLEHPDAYMREGHKHDNESDTEDSEDRKARKTSIIHDTVEDGIIVFVSYDI